MMIAAKNLAFGQFTLWVTFLMETSSPMPPFEFHIFYPLKVGNFKSTPNYFLSF